MCVCALARVCACHGFAGTTRALNFGVRVCVCVCMRGRVLACVCVCVCACALLHVFACHGFAGTELCILALVRACVGGWHALCGCAGAWFESPRGCVAWQGLQEFCALALGASQAKSRLGPRSSIADVTLGDVTSYTTTPHSTHTHIHTPHTWRCLLLQRSVRTARTTRMARMARQLDCGRRGEGGRRRGPCCQAHRCRRSHWHRQAGPRQNNQLASADWPAGCAMLGRCQAVLCPAQCRSMPCRDRNACVCVRRRWGHRLTRWSSAHRALLTRLAGGVMQCVCLCTYAHVHAQMCMHACTCSHAQTPACTQAHRTAHT